jgi:hypothetical protein
MLNQNGGSVLKIIFIVQRAVYLIHRLLERFRRDNLKIELVRFLE